MLLIINPKYTEISNKDQTNLLKSGNVKTGDNTSFIGIAGLGISVSLYYIFIKKSISNKIKDADALFILIIDIIVVKILFLIIRYNSCKILFLIKC